MKLLKLSTRTLLPFIIVLLFSCAVITVNVYFPAHDVEKAYENLEDQLMKGTPPSPQKKGPAKSLEPSGPKSTEPSASSPQSLHVPSSWFVATAYAGENLAAEIAHRIMRMPEVVRAYRRMGKRLPIINRLRDQKRVGEAKSGFLEPFVRLNRNEALAMEDENHDRSIIINGMAQAILEINHLPVNRKNMANVYPKAAAQFADLRRKRAKPGWKIQMPDVQWVVKR